MRKDRKQQRQQTAQQLQEHVKFQDTPENVAKAMFRVGRKPKGGWRYLNNTKHTES